MPLTIHTKVETAKLARILPRPFARQWRTFKLPEPATVIVFDDEVIRSGALHRAFKRAPQDAEAPLVVVGRDFTAEARSFLADRCVAVLDLEHFGWTDASHLAVRDVGRKTKR